MRQFKAIHSQKIYTLHDSQLAFVDYNSARNDNAVDNSMDSDTTENVGIRLQIVVFNRNGFGTIGIPYNQISLK